MAGYENFERQYRVIAGPGGAEGFEIGAVTKEYPVPLHIEFAVEKGDAEAQNNGRITIWNLNKEHLAVLNGKDCVLALRAGYKNHLSLIFAGIISHVKTTADGADRRTEIELVDNLVEIRDTFVSVSYAGKISWKEIMDDVAAQMGCVISYSYNATFSDLNNGFSYVGRGRDILTKGCNCCGLSWSIQNGVIQVKKPNDTMNREVYVLSPETGLLGVPAKVSIEQSTSSSDTNANKQTGWEVSYFLNGAIQIDDFVRLESREATGYFRVHKLTMQGDSQSGDWVSTAELLEVNG